jgi:hypothetical protein
MSTELQAKDLKINNALTRKSSPQTTCYVNGNMICEIERYGARDYIPIPIDEKWLRKLGWNYYTGSGDKGDMTKDFGGKIDIDWVDGCMQTKSHYEGKDMYRKMNHIKYVHQLQNLEVLNLEE